MVMVAFFNVDVGGTRNSPNGAQLHQMTVWEVIPQYTTGD